METIKLIISDETLRDGEQQVGLCFNHETKCFLAHQIAQTGVHQIALMPAIHPTEEQIAKTLIAEGLSHQLIASTLLSKTLIERASAMGVQQIILFYAVSDRLLVLRDMASPFYAMPLHSSLEADIPAPLIEKVRTNMLQNVLEHLHYAAQLGLRICFAAEDASRAELEFLAHCIHTFSPYLEHFLLCDTVGVLTPEKTFSWVRSLLDATQAAPLLVHFHNDMGLALENTIQAILAGAAGISGTFGGIGERAGNVALEQIVNGLRLRFGWEVAGIDYDAVNRVSQLLDQLGIRAHPPYSQASQRHEAGIHVHSLMRDRLSYSTFPYSQPEIWFGKHSGVSNVRFLFEYYLNQSLPQEQYEQICQDIKSLAIQHNRSFSVEEVLAWLNTSGAGFSGAMRH